MMSISRILFSGCLASALLLSSQGLNTESKSLASLNSLSCLSTLSCVNGVSAQTVDETELLLSAMVTDVLDSSDAASLASDNAKTDSEKARAAAMRAAVKAKAEAVRQARKELKEMSKASSTGAAAPRVSSSSAAVRASSSSTGVFVPAPVGPTATPEYAALFASFNSALARFSASLSALQVSPNSETGQEYLQAEAQVNAALNAAGAYLLAASLDSSLTVEVGAAALAQAVIGAQSAQATSNEANAAYQAASRSGMAMQQELNVLIVAFELADRRLALANSVLFYAQQGLQLAQQRAAEAAALASSTAEAQAN